MIPFSIKWIHNKLKFIINKFIFEIFAKICKKYIFYYSKKLTESIISSRESSMDNVLCKIN